MRSEDFRRITDVFPDAALLITKDGVIQAANRGVDRLGLRPSELAGRNVRELIASPLSELDEYLRFCARSSEPLVGAVQLRRDDGDTIDCRIYGSAIPARSEGEAPHIILRLTERQSGTTQFAILNQKIEELSDEVRRRRRVEAELREQSQWLRVTLSSIGDAVITTDAEGRVTFLNPMAESLTGWSNADAYQRPIDEVFRIINEDTRQNVDNPVHKVLRTGRIVGLDSHTLLISRDGNDRPIDDSAAPIRDESGRIGGVVLVFRDNSAQRRADEDLRRSRRLLQNVLDNTPAVIYLKDREGKILLANRRYCELAERTIDEVLGKTDLEVFGDRLDPVAHENDRQVFTTGGPLQFIEQVRVADGVRTFLAVKTVIEDVGYPEPVLVGIATDISEREKAKEEIDRLLHREKRQTLRLVQLASASLSIHSALTVQTVLQVTTAEAQRIIGAHQAISRLAATAEQGDATAPQVALFSDKYADASPQSLRREVSSIESLVCRENRAIRLTREQCAAQGEPELFTVDCGESRRPGGWLAAPFVGRDGRNLGLIELSDKYEGDFTDDDLSILQQLASVASVAIENARLYQELRDADRRKDDFLAMLAHELRNPLAPIRNALALLGMPDLDAPTRRQANDIINRQVEHLVRLVDDLLDVSRIMRGRIELRPEPVEVRSIIERAVETVQPLIELHQHQLELRVPPQPIWVEADLIRMAQVVFNLLNNAAKYTPAGGRIELIVEPVERGVAIRVRDNGVGIDADLLPHIFDLFTQSKRSVERSQGGLGIGLTLVRSLVEMHGGAVSACSAGSGKGSEFVVSLPTLASQHQRKSTVVAAPEPSRSLRVLVVEDIVGSAKMMASMLHKFWKHEVRIAHDGLEAIDLAREFHPELVLLDIGLPQLDGYEVARRLRALPETEQAVIVALTGYGTQEDRRRSQEAGFDEHLVKPASVDNLRALFHHPRLAEPPTK